MMKNRNEIAEINVEFALLIISFKEILETLMKYMPGKLSLKSATAIGANNRERQSAKSIAYFAYEHKISFSEAEENSYCLLLCDKPGSYPSLLKASKYKLLSIQKLLSKFISSSKKS